MIRNTEEEIVEDYNNSTPRFHDALQQLVGMLKRNFGNFPIKFGIKSLSSVLDKMKRKPYESIFDMPDIVRATLLVPPKYDEIEPEGIKFVVNKCKRIFKFDSLEEKNDPSSGYGNAYHGNFTINGIKCELIIYYANMDQYKEEAHKVYESVRSGKEVTRDDLFNARKLLRVRQNPENINRDRLDKYRSGKNRINKKDIADLLNLYSEEYKKQATEAFIRFLKIARKKYFIKHASDEKFNFIVLQKPLAIGKEKEIEKFIENHGAIIKNKKEILIDSRQISKHYRQFFGKDFFMPLLKYFVGKKVTVWLVYGNEFNLNSMRKDIGGPKPEAGSFRSELVEEKYKDLLSAHGVLDNGIHVSDSRSEGEREAQIWFGIPKLFLEYHNDDINKKTEFVHNMIWEKLNSIPYANVQYANTNNETAVKSKPVDIDYRVLVPEEKIDETVNLIEDLIPGSEYDRTGIDERTGATYKKLEFKYQYGKADIAVVPVQHYKDRIGAGHLTDLLTEEEKREIGKRKEEAFLKGKEEYNRVKNEIRDEIKLKYGF